jgi:hypothetical protein
LPLRDELDSCTTHPVMDNDRYLFKLQQEYLEKSKLYMDMIRDGKSLLELKEQAYALRCLIIEIRAVKEEITRCKKE